MAQQPALDDESWRIVLSRQVEPHVPPADYSGWAIILSTEPELVEDDPAEDELDLADDEDPSAVARGKRWVRQMEARTGWTAATAWSESITSGISPRVRQGLLWAVGVALAVFFIALALGW